MQTDTQSGTTINEITDGIYRISTPVSNIPGGFTFNQYLVTGDQPLLFHTGPRRMFSYVRGAIDAVMPVSKLRYVSFSHFEADECGSLNEFLAVAPGAMPLCGRIAAMVSIGDFADRSPRALADGEALSLGSHSVRWFDTPHLPHAWECGFLFEENTHTLLCGDLFTMGGDKHPAITEGDIIEPSEAFRGHLDYYSHTKGAAGMIERLASLHPRTLALMHGPAWQGDGAAVLRALGSRLTS